MPAGTDKTTRRLFSLGYFLFGLLLFCAAAKLLSSMPTDVHILSAIHEIAAVACGEETSGSDVYTEILSAEEHVSEFDSNQDLSSVQYTTPSDVENMEADYLAVFAQYDTDGNVLEDDFSIAGATNFVDKAAVRNATAEKNPEFGQLLLQGADLAVADTDAPLVLIYHTHTSESYLLADNGVFWNAYDTHTREEDRNMIRIGAEIAQVLKDAGIGVIHDTTVYDSDYNQAYANSRQGITEILEENPSVQIVLDVHRDAFYYSDTSRGKPVVEIDGKKAAQIMIITGAEEGSVTDFSDWEYNLRFALELQNTASDMYEGLMRPLYFCQRKYNMDIMKNAVLLEIGSDANTLDEAMYAAHLFGHALVQLIENHK